METLEGEKIKICTLCFHPCGTLFKTVDRDIIKMMSIVLLYYESTDEREVVMCSKCAGDLKTCFEFKLSCLSSEDSHFIPREQNTNLYCRNRKECSINSDLPETHVICDLCKKVVIHNLYVSSEDKAHGTLKISLNRYFPELVPNVTRDISICSSCSTILECYFQVMLNWSDAKQNRENKIMTITYTESQNDVKPKLVLKTEGSLGDVNLNNLMVNENKDEVKLNLLSTEISSSVERLEEVNFKHEEVDLKDEADEFGMNENNTLAITASKKAVYHQCTLCDYTTKRKYCLQKHLLIHQKDFKVKTYGCELCTYKAKKKYNLQQHMLVHQDPSTVVTYGCEICSFRTKWKGHLRGHMLIHQDASEVITYDCELCPYKTNKKSCLRLHFLIHQDASQVTMLQCEFCSFSTKRKGNLRNHMLIHKDISKVVIYRCGLCNYQTKWKSNLHIHMLTHQDASNVRTYECDLCPYKSKRKDNLSRHMLTHQDGSHVTIFTCELCSYKTKRKDNLNQHKLIHQDSSKVETYSCELCSYKAKWKGNLRNHMLTHQEDKHGCKLCPYKSRKKDQLHKHQMSHQDASMAVNLVEPIRTNFRKIFTTDGQ